MSVNLENSTTTSTTVDQAMEEAVRIANASAAKRHAGKPLAIKAENLTRIYKIRVDKKDKKKKDGAPAKTMIALGGPRD